MRFRSKMTSVGFTLLGDPLHPICPIMLGDARLAVEFAEEMLKQGVFVIGFSYPVWRVRERSRRGSRRWVGGWGRGWGRGEGVGVGKRGREIVY